MGKTSETRRVQKTNREPQKSRGEIGKAYGGAFSCGVVRMSAAKWAVEYIFIGLWAKGFGFRA